MNLAPGIVLARIGRLQGEAFRRYLDRLPVEFFDGLPADDFRYVLERQGDEAPLADAERLANGEAYSASTQRLARLYRRFQALAGLAGSVRWTPYVQGLVALTRRQVRRLELARSQWALGCDFRPSRQVPLVFNVEGLRERPSVQPPAL